MLNKNFTYLKILDAIQDLAKLFKIHGKHNPNVRYT